jgi:hypothetical protein
MALKNGSPDRILCGPENFERRELKNKTDLADDVGESVEGWGTWAKPGFGSKLHGGHSQSKIGRNKRLDRSTETREKPPTMTPNDLPPCTFKEDLARMSGAFRLNANDSVFEASTESLGLGEGEEFILIKVSKGQRKCWATFLSNDPELPYVDMFPIGTLIEKCCETEISKKAGVRMLKSKRRQSRSSTGGLQNRERRIVPASDKLSNHPLFQDPLNQDHLNQTKALVNLPLNLKKMNKQVNGKS